MESKRYSVSFQNACSLVLLAVLTCSPRTSAFVLDSGAGIFARPTATDSSFRETLFAAGQKGCQQRSTVQLLGRTRGYVRRRSQVHRFLTIPSVEEAGSATTLDNNREQEISWNRNTKQQHGASLSKSDLLDSLNLPYGLQQELLEAASQDKVFKRFWIVDNSGSMAVQDGHTMRSIAMPKVTKTLAASVPCSTAEDHNDAIRPALMKEPTLSRWAEVQETVQTHAQLMATLEAPTEFRLLNAPVPSTDTSSSQCTSTLCSRLGWLRLPKIPVAVPVPAEASGCPQSFRVGYSAKTKAKDSQRARSIMARSEPKGQTPLIEAIRQVKADIVQVLPQLQEGQSIVLVLATDGSTVSKETIGKPEGDPARESAQVVAALRELEGLPVSVVLRLCTDYATVVDQYNRLDSEDACNVSLQEHCSTSLRVDVLDDYMAEAKEVYEHNPWLNYPIILHRLREMGPVDPLFDLLDERPLTRMEIKEFVERILVGRMESENDALSLSSDQEWHKWVEAVNRLQSNERLQRHPITQTWETWFDCNQLMHIVDEPFIL